MVFGLNPSTSQTFSTFYQNALHANSKSSSGTSAGVKAGAAVGAIAGAALILAVIFYFWRRHRKHAMAALNPEQGNTQPAMAQPTQHNHSEWPAEIKPPTPPEGAELHHFSKPGELENPNHPVELHNGDEYHNEPVEMWTPDHAAPSDHPPGYRSIDNGVSPNEP